MRYWTWSIHIQTLEIWRLKEEDSGSWNGSNWVMFQIIFSTPLWLFAATSFAVFLCRTSVGEALCDLLCCGRVTISVTRVSAASRAAVSSVMSGKSMSMSRDGAVVVGKYHSIEEITSAIITAAKLCQIPLFFGRGTLMALPEKPESRSCNLWSHPGVPPGASIKMKLNYMIFLIFFFFYNLWC